MVGNSGKRAHQNRGRVFLMSNYSTKLHSVITATATGMAVVAALFSPLFLSLHGFYGALASVMILGGLMKERQSYAWLGILLMTASASLNVFGWGIYLLIIIGLLATVLCIKYSLNERLKFTRKALYSNAMIALAATIGSSYLIFKLISLQYNLLPETVFGLIALVATVKSLSEKDPALAIVSTVILFVTAAIYPQTAALYLLVGAFLTLAISILLWKIHEHRRATDR